MVGCKLPCNTILLFAVEELIDTQWDVNTVGFVQIPADAVGINRYIVGCKFIPVRQDHCYCFELIDTQWDVNSLAVDYEIVTGAELIDTQWDVN